jgi:hypothetical protein
MSASSAFFPAGWCVSATATAATATATKAAVPATYSKHVIFGIDVSFAAVSSVASTITINDGASPVWTLSLPIGTATFSRTFVRGIALTAGNAASAVLTSGGTGIVGSVNLDGVTA